MLWMISKTATITNTEVKYQRELESQSHIVTERAVFLFLLQRKKNEWNFSMGVKKKNNVYT